jgi:hypothetical protein
MRGEDPLLAKPESFTHSPVHSNLFAPARIFESVRPLVSPSTFPNGQLNKLFVFHVGGQPAECSPRTQHPGEDLLGQLFLAHCWTTPTDRPTPTRSLCKSSCTHLTCAEFMCAYYLHTALFSHIRLVGHRQHSRKSKKDFHFWYLRS